MPAARASLASLAEAVCAGDLADELGRGQGPEAGLSQQVRRDPGDQVSDFGFQRLDRLAQFADAAQLVAGDPDARRLLRAGEPAGDARPPRAVKQRAARELQFGPEIVQMPLQRVVDRDPRANEALAVIDQQPQVELGPVQVRGRQRVETFTQRGPGDRERVDAVGLAAPAGLAPRPGHQRRVHPQNPFAALDQKPLQRARDMPAVLDRPDALVAQAARPCSSAAAPLAPDGDRLLAEQLARRRTRPQRSCASACGCPHRARSLTSSTSTSTGLDTRRTRLARGDATLLSSHAKASTTGDERHSERQSDPRPTA